MQSSNLKMLVRKIGGGRVSNTQEFEGTKEFVKERRVFGDKGNVEYYAGFFCAKLRWMSRQQGSISNGFRARIELRGY
jgi:hypothetical protein